MMSIKSYKNIFSGFLSLVRLMSIKWAREQHYNYDEYKKL